MKKNLFFVAALIFTAGIWSCGNEVKKVDPNSLFSTFYKPNSDVERAQKIASSLENLGLAGAQTDSDSLKSALELYQTGKNNEALSMLNSILAAHPDNGTAQYYIGVIHMADGRFDQAIEALTPISNKEGSEFQFDALWNLGLCYLKTENGTQKARKFFIKLVKNSNNPNQANAKALVDQLPDK